MNQRAVDLIAERLPNGLTHPGDPNSNQPAMVLPMPGLSSLGMAAEQAAEFASEAGLPSNDAPRLLAEALVHLLETDGGFELVDRARLEELEAAAKTPDEAAPAAPTVSVLCAHFRKPLAQLTAGRAQVLVDCDDLKRRIDEIHGA
jgi:hypothetical protein